MIRVSRDGSTGLPCALEPTEAPAAACVEVANSPAFKVDRPGVPIHLPPAVAETMHVDLIGP